MQYGGKGLTSPLRQLQPPLFPVTSTLLTEWLLGARASSYMTQEPHLQSPLTRKAA